MSDLLRCPSSKGPHVPSWVRCGLSRRGRLASHLILLLAVNCLFASSAIASSAVGFHLDQNIVIQNKYYESPVIRFDEPMDRAILSWNATTPGKSRLIFSLRARLPNGKWSRWFSIGEWGSHIVSRSFSPQQRHVGKVDVDTLMLDEGATEWQYHVDRRYRRGEAPIVSTVALAVKNSKLYAKRDERRRTALPIVVPALSQFVDGVKEDDPQFSHRICSPTSVAMVLEHYHIPIASLPEFASSVYDRKADMYGNWPFNTARLFIALHERFTNQPLVTYVRWYESLDDLVASVGRFGPAVVSIAYEDGALDGAPLPTQGHLLVVRGANRKYIYVNDPAAPERRTVPRKYRRDQFLKAWKGVVYVVDMSSHHQRYE